MIKYRTYCTYKDKNFLWTTKREYSRLDGKSYAVLYHIFGYLKSRIDVIENQKLIASKDDII